MADLKAIPGGQAPALRPAGAAAAPSRAAQRAFFDAALAGTGPAAPVTAQPESPPGSFKRDQPDPPASGRLLRPGSFLDIKV